MRKIIVAAAVACALGARAEERTVKNAAELVAALQALNGTGGTIYLETGDYDVGPYDYGGYWSSATKFVTTNGICHLALNNVTLIGKSDNPRDTVIYGNRTSGIIYSYIGKMSNLTISNGYFSADRSYGAGVYATSTGSIFSNMVVTCCVNASPKKGNGGGVYDGKWYDSTIISNAVVKNSGGGICMGELHNCSVISNYAGGTGGGAYYAVKLYDCRVIGNTAASTGGGIGGLAAAGSSCRVYGGLVAGNTAPQGGGVTYSLFYGGTVVSNNTATGKNGGGGVYSDNSRFVSNAVFVCNTATAGVGGAAYGGTLVGCEIFGNRARDGGGVYGSVCENCTITNNVSTQSGGGGNSGTYTNCVIAGNSATTDGGGLYNGAAVDCRILDNEATQSGGGGYLGSYTNCVIAGNSAAKYGGGLYKFEAVDCHIFGNTAATGGGLFNGAAVDCRIYGNVAATGGGCGLGSFTGCTITNNLATDAYGGGCYTGAYTNCLIACNSLLSLSTKTVAGGGLCDGVAVRCTIVSNTVGTLSSDSKSAASGGGASGSEIIDSFVGYNQTTGGVASAFGGGLYAGSASNCLIAGNAAWGSSSNQGGGASGTALTNCIVRNNAAGLGCGLNYGSAYGCLFSNNVSQTSAAANVLRRPLWVENCEIVGTCMMSCWAKNCRFVNFTNGAYFAEGENIRYSGHIPGVNSVTLLSSGLSLTNCLVANNKCGTGGLFACSATKGIDLVSCTIADNELSTTVWYTTNGMPGVVENCIFVGNKTTSGTAHNLWYAQSATNLWISNCLIGSGRATDVPVFEVNTITNDNAKFVGGDGPDRYALKRTSPAVGKGLVQDWMTDALDVRQDPAFPRLRDGKVDIGCYQCWLNPVGLWFSIR